MEALPIPMKRFIAIIIGMTVDEKTQIEEY